MIAIAVDDEVLMLGALIATIKASPDIAELFDFSSCEEALEFVKGNSADIAFLVDRNGAWVSVAEICVALWENDKEHKKYNYIHQLFRDLRQTLENAGMEAVFERNNYLYSINPAKMDCDYFSYLKTGKPDLGGEYMTQYSWAEGTCGLPWDRKIK